MKIYRVITYIDGFNLYHGLRAKSWNCYYWLDLWELSKNLLKPNQKLVQVKYFTAKIKNPPNKRKRQNAYLRALKTMANIESYFGKYETSPLTCGRCSNQVICSGCGNPIDIPEEKMTDVQLASHLIVDAFKNRYDTALLVTGDRDFVPAVEACRDEFPNKYVIAVFPPLRTCDELRYACNTSYHITEKELKNSTFPLEIEDNMGRKITCPERWR